MQDLTDTLSAYGILLQIDIKTYHYSKVWNFCFNVLKEWLRCFNLQLRYFQLSMLKTVSVFFQLQVTEIQLNLVKRKSCVLEALPWNIFRCFLILWKLSILVCLKPSASLFVSQPFARETQTFKQLFCILSPFPCF